MNNVAITGMTYIEALETLRGNASVMEYVKGTKELNDKAYLTLQIMIDRQYFMGYNLELLEAYGDLLNRNEITPDQLKNANENIKYGYQLAIKQYEKAFKESLNRVIGEKR